MMTTDVLIHGADIHAGTYSIKRGQSNDFAVLVYGDEHTTTKLYLLEAQVRTLVATLAAAVAEWDSMLPVMDANLDTGSR